MTINKQKVLKYIPIVQLATLFFGIDTHERTMLNSKNV